MLNINDFIHPEDKQALDFLKSIPFAPELQKKLLKYYEERVSYGCNMGSKIRLSKKQIPHIYNLLPPICQKLGTPEPEFYLVNDPVPNAYAMGENRPNITLQSGIVETMSDDELVAVIAHECGHIFCHHMLYTNLVNTYLKNKTMPSQGVFDSFIIALLYWERKSELSCDRVAAYITSPETTISMLARLAGAPRKIAHDFDVYEYAEQAKAYDQIKTDNLWDMTLNTWVVLDKDHPFAAVRVREILKWTGTDQYLNLKAGIPLCPSCHKPIENDWKYCEHCGFSLK